MKTITWDTISYKQFKQLEEIIDKELTTDNLIKILSIIHNKPIDYFEALNLKSLQEYIEGLDLLKEQIPTIKEQRIIHLNNKLYGLINLDNISYTEYELCKTYLQNKDYAGIQSILYREIKNIGFLTRVYLFNLNKNKSKDNINYKLYDYSYERSLEYKKEFENQNIILPYNTALFFCLLATNYMNNTKIFSKIQEMVQVMDYQKSGDQS